MPNISSYQWWIYAESNLDSSADQYFFHLMEPVEKIGNVEGLHPFYWFTVHTPVRACKNGVLAIVL